MEQEDARAAAELWRLDAETEKLKAEATKLDEEACRFQYGTFFDAIKLALALFAAVAGAVKLIEGLGWL